MNIEILRLVERAQIATEVGESHFREFKSAYSGAPGSKKPRDIKEISYDIAYTLVAFANADGGELFVGIEDNSMITGVDFDENTIDYLLNAPKTYVHKTTPLPSLKTAIIKIEDKTILYYSVTKGVENVYITSDGKCLQRKDMESVPIAPKTIEFSRQEIESREYDRKFIDSASLSDLRIDLIEQLSNDLYRISAEKFLQYLELGEFDGGSIRLKKAALLLFANDVSKWHPRCQVRVIRVNGTQLLSGRQYNVQSDKVQTNNIVSLIEKAWELLRPNLAETKLAANALFKTQVMYPELACREALINAVAHRDYSIEGRGIEIYVYDDRIEFISPGELLSSIRLDDILKQTGVHQSRNTLVARALREIGYMRELGEGVRRIFQLLNDNELVSPDILSADTTFKITMYQKTIYTLDEQLWLDNFKDIALSRDEKTIIRLGCKGQLISPQNIWDVVGIVDTDYYRQLIEKLHNKGILVTEVSKTRANNISRKKKIDKKQVARFMIKIPETPYRKTAESSRLSIPSHEISQSSTQPQFETTHENSSINAIASPSDNEVIDESDYAKIGVLNIPYSTTKKDVLKLLSQYGDIASITLPVNVETGKLRGFSLVEFSKAEDAKRLLAEAPVLFLGENKVYLQKYIKLFNILV